MGVLLGYYTSVFFMHIPKTGGMSVENYLTTLVPVDQVAPYPLVDTCKYLNPESSNKFRFYFSHTPAYFAQLLPSPVFRFTWLRDPVDRAISAYNHILREPSHPWHTRMRNLTTDFESFIKHPQLRHHLVDAMTVFLGSEISLTLAEGDEQSIGAVSRAAIATPPDRYTLGRAKARVNEFDFIGFTDRLEKDCEALAAALGVQPRPFGMKLNCDTNVDTFRPRVTRSEEIEGLVWRHSPYDIELYSYAREKWLKE